eukprot:CAMPEP_0170175294 /NCGR_PEP_ID=MMETSP0040_2-20121228/8392_1 /TAXON_ID=641309 /ORGANISM="Lotharella oceanica, Strain CCMP622" /LENGTH=92 /DNA_ID=CAMNT_0010417223 /DNA_START=1496 /DNA_END=1772 /DNA_ORIENTATION=-
METGHETVTVEPVAISVVADPDTPGAIAVEHPVEIRRDFSLDLGRISGCLRAWFQPPSPRGLEDSGMNMGGGRLGSPRGKFFQNDDDDDDDD